MGALKFDPAAELLKIQNRGGAPAKIANPAKQTPGFSSFSEISRGSTPNSIFADPPQIVVSASSEDEFEERAAKIEAGSGAPRAWAEGFARLDLASVPEGFTESRWLEVLNAGGRFLDDWASQAAKLGWSATDVFGVHPAAPAARVSHHGLALLIGDGSVIAITGETATIRRRSGAILTYRREPQADAVPLWSLAQ